MKIYVIRHGQSEANLADYYAGYLPVKLSGLGRQQAEKARKYLANITMDQVFCSDLERAKETAKIIFPNNKLNLMPALREINVGKIQGMQVQECKSKWPHEYIEAEKNQNFSYFGGETAEEMRHRIESCLRQIERVKADYIAIVGHEGTVRETLNYALGEIVLLEHLKIDNASVSVFDVEEEKWRLDKWNYTGTLQPF